MTSSGTKRIVVIRDIPSNIVEEAILILKTNASEKVDKLEETSAWKGLGKTSKGSSILVKEAEMIIDHYIRSSSTKGSAVKSVPDEKERKRRLYTNIIINIGLMGSIFLFIFLVSRLI